MQACAVAYSATRPADFDESVAHLDLEYAPIYSARVDPVQDWRFGQRLAHYRRSIELEHARELRLPFLITAFLEARVVSGARVSLEGCALRDASGSRASKKTDLVRRGGGVSLCGPGVPGCSRW
jgi:hypothetical protein